MTARHARPRVGSGVGFGLEAWLIGTPAELDAALSALAAAGRIRYQGIGRPGARMPLAGADYGRFRAYALIHVPFTPPGGSRLGRRKRAAGPHSAGGRHVLPRHRERAVSRSDRAHYDPDGARHGSVPTWPWRMTPEGLLTRRQLAAAGLRPDGQQPTGQVCWTSRRYSARRQSRTRFALLYRVELALPRQEPSAAQLGALAKANSTRRAYPTCGQITGYVIPRALGECLDCACQLGGRRSAA